MKISEFFNKVTEKKGESKKDISRKALKSLLKKLRHKQHELKDKLQKEKDSHKRRKLKIEIKIIKLQRKKGLKLLKRSK